MTGERRWTYLVALPLLLLACAGLAHGSRAATPASEASPSPKDVRFVLLHLPGPSWEPGKPIFEQQGVQEHIDYYRQLHAAGKLVLGGPFLDNEGGGMMIPEAGVSEEEITRFAQEDPAVKSGLLEAVVRPWLIGMKK